MLQFNTTIVTITSRYICRCLWRLNASKYTTTISEVQNTSKLVPQKVKSTQIDANFKRFEGLKLQLRSAISANSLIATKIQDAKDIEEILKILKAPEISKDDSLIFFKTVATWMNEKSEIWNSNLDDISNKDINTDIAPILPEMKKLDTTNTCEDDVSKYQDLSTVQIILEISKLAQEGKRKLELLNYLFQNIIEYSEVIPPGACSNLLFSMHKLCYSDERLLKKICTDFRQYPSEKINIKTITSVIRSMSLIRYKNNLFLDNMCTAVINSNVRYTSKQIESILMSLALLGYYSDKINEIIEKYKNNLTLNSLGCIAWLNLMWSFAIFKILKASDIEKILQQRFVSKLLSGSNNKLSVKLKLLNINGYAQYVLKDYSGPLITENQVECVTHPRSKQKQIYVDTLKQSLEVLFPNKNHFAMDINSKMGFLIDAELHIDSNFHLLDVNNKTHTDHNCTRIAIMMVDYYDTCLGSSEFHGLSKLHHHLLTCKQYKILHIPYQYFGLEDKIGRRVKYLSRQLCEKFKMTLS